MATSRVNRPCYRLHSVLPTPAIIFFMLVAAPQAAAQSSDPDRADALSGDNYRVEFAAPYWRPAADLIVASDGRGVRGTDIDLKGDLALRDAAFWSFQCSVRAASRHTLRFEYLPIRYESSSTLLRDVVFNGIRYGRGVAVSSTFDWTSYRFDYQYRLLTRKQGFAAVMVEGRQTIVRLRLIAPEADESRRTSVPIPALGGVARFYPAKRVSVTGEVVGLKVPNSADKRYGGSYVDFTVYGAANLTPHVGAQIGFRSIHVGHFGESDAATLALPGVYVAAVARYD
jgi:hypothetical protein